MDLGLNIAAAGMVAQQTQVDQLAGDLANVQTPGYKPEAGIQTSFGALLLANTATGAPIGAIDSGVEVRRGVPNLTQATIHTTGRPLDFAISGSGFFAVRTPNGVQYTRNGQFSLDAQGQLVDSAGDPVLSGAGTPIRATAGPGAPVAAAAIGVVALTNPTKLGNNNFTGTPAGVGPGVVQAGALEASGVDQITTYTHMQSDLDAYQAAQQSISTIGQTLAESAATVGLVTG